MFRLEKLQSLVKKRKIVGRGGARGGQSGRGGKGQTARSGGNPRLGFEGGQMPLMRRLPKRGFNNSAFRCDFEVVNLDRIAAVFGDEATVTKQDLMNKGLVRSKKGLAGTEVTRVKVLAGGGLTKKLIIFADSFSKTAEQAIVRNGGQARIIEEK
jgi:large subunit ribosomal protein L15